MVFETVRLLIALIGSSIGGLWDLKTTNIPDPLIYSMAVSGILLHVIEGLLTGNFTPLLWSLAFGFVFLLFSLLMYYSGQWGGGDGGLLVSIAILLPTASVQTMFPFAISFFINSIFIGAIYSIVYAIVIAVRNKEISKKFYSAIKADSKVLVSIVFISFLATLLFSYIKPLNVFVFIPVMVLILYVFQKFAKLIEQSFYKKIPASRLRIDDMIGEDMPKLKIYKKYLRGLTEKEVAQIKKIKKYVTIREGVRYGIVFPLSLIFTLLFKDFILIFIGTI